MNWQDALESLKAGNENFVQDKLDGKLQGSSRRDSLTAGQSPYAIVLSCADSRVVPELAFDKGLGEIFVIRVAGNVANDSSVASIEYAVAHLGTKLIVVLGHESCGAVTAAAAGVKESPCLDHLLTQIEPSVKNCASSEINDIVKQNASDNAATMLNKSEIIKNAVEKDGVKVVSAYYNLGSGKVDFL